MLRIGFSKTLASGADNTPSALNWADISYYDSMGQFTYSVQRIQNITSSITLSVTFATGTGGQAVPMYYKISTSAPSWTNGGTTFEDPVFNSFTQIVTGGTIVVNNNNYLSFAVFDVDFPYAGNSTVTVRNVTDSNTILDTYIIDCGS
tara:strand:- start:2818 stop:3261 length:444 start_codon:yes stop_codon:yes gene_type:complete